MNTEIMMQNLHVGLMMAIIGMGVVIFFLVFMMGVMRLTEVMMKKLNKIFPEEIPQEKQPKKTNNNTNEEIAVAIATMFRNKNIVGGGK